MSEPRLEPGLLRGLGSCDQPVAVEESVAGARRYRLPRASAIAHAGDACAVELQRQNRHRYET